MILKNITFTGADDKVNKQELYDISASYPMVEWGILWYPKKMGTQRYPTKKWIREFLDDKPDGVNVSLHICGVDALNFCYSKKDSNFDESEIWDYMHKCDRIQLNFPKSKFNLDDVLGLLERRHNYDFRYAVNRYHAYHPGKYVIIQANKGNKILNACLEEVPYVEFLFDESRGGGKSILEYPTPISQKYNGYAGGINPDNILTILHDLKKVVPEDGEIWIDMETGIRTDNEFDLRKVKSVIYDCIISKYLVES
jgi:hypothetical protein